MEGESPTLRTLALPVQCKATPAVQVRFFFKSLFGSFSNIFFIFVSKVNIQHFLPQSRHQLHPRYTASTPPTLLRYPHEHATHTSSPTTQPTQARHSPQPTVARHSRHPHMHTTNATHVRTNSISQAPITTVVPESNVN